MSSTKAKGLGDPGGGTWTGLPGTGTAPGSSGVGGLYPCFLILLLVFPASCRCLWYEVFCRSIFLSALASSVPACRFLDE